MASEISKGAGDTPVEVATLGGGCFWCIEAILSELKGVEKVESGYSGGRVHNPSYEMVCSDTTGHAEVVQVTFRPDIISYRELLQVFFTLHDPTTPNRQGADVGSQYRSIILYNGDLQKSTAEKVIAEVDRAGTWGSPVVTELKPLKAFYRAEGYHQQYYKNNRFHPYCQAVIAPKVAKLRHLYQERLKASP
jgi:peptide-methionine (S)-S-oxide reductase